MKFKIINSDQGQVGKVDYKSLLIKYINHIRFNEGIDYLSEGRISDSDVFTEEEKEEMLKLAE